MPGRLDGKVAIITGAARGQGAAEARLFVAEGANVVLADVLDEEGQKLADELADAAAFVHLDVTDEDAWATVVSGAEERFGHIDVLVNNAGILRFGPLATTTLAQYMKVVNINQIGTFLGMRSVIEPMMRTGGGSIVNISSTDGLQGMPYLVAYVSSKFAVRGMTKSAAIELAEHGIRVNSVHPGGIDTPMVNPDGVDDPDPTGYVTERVPLRRFGSADEVANMVLFLASDESSYCTGAEFVVDGGYTAGHSIPSSR